MNAKELRDLFASGRAYVACDGERLIDEATAREADAIAARALRLLAAAEANDGGTPETDAIERQHGLDWFGLRDERDRYIDSTTRFRDSSRRLERERNGLAARVRELEHAVDLAARTMAGEGVEDQGQAWDKCLRILDAERSK